MKRKSFTQAIKAKVNTDLKSYDAAPYVQKKVAEAERILDQLKKPVVP